jgi:hypothetical protein
MFGHLAWWGLWGLWRKTFFSWLGQKSEARLRNRSTRQPFFSLGISGV